MKGVGANLKNVQNVITFKKYVNKECRRHVSKTLLYKQGKHLQNLVRLISTDQQEHRKLKLKI